MRPRRAAAQVGALNGDINNGCPVIGYGEIGQPGWRRGTFGKHPEIIGSGVVGDTGNRCGVGAVQLDVKYITCASVRPPCLSSINPHLK